VTGGVASEAAGPPESLHRIAAATRGQQGHRENTQADDDPCVPGEPVSGAEEGASWAAGPAFRRSTRSALLPARTTAT
jgi:hypothetical protein